MENYNLKALRKSLQLTIGYCADHMHVTRQTIRNIEEGITTKESSLYFYELFLKDVKRRSN